MKKRYVVLMLLSLGLVGPGDAEPPPAVYREAVQRQLNNRFNENEIISFVYQVYAMYDRHVPVGRFLPFLASKNLEMRFPETTLRSHADFKLWYAGIGKTITSNTHTLESVKASVLGGGRYQAEIVGVWQAESKKGEFIVFKFRQRWSLVDGPNRAAVDSDISRRSGKLNKDRGRGPPAAERKGAAVCYPLPRRHCPSQLWHQLLHHRGSCH